MTNAASTQGLEIFREKLRDFLEQSETGRQAIGMSEKGGIRMDSLNSNGTTKAKVKEEEDIDEI